MIDNIHTPMGTTTVAAPAIAIMVKTTPQIILEYSNPNGPMSNVKINEVNLDLVEFLMYCSSFALRATPSSPQ